MSSLGCPSDSPANAAGDNDGGGSSDTADGGAGDDASVPNNPSAPALVTIQAPSSLGIPRGNGEPMMVDITTHDGFDGYVDFTISGLPHGIWCTGDYTIQSSESAAAFTCLAQSDAPDGLFTAKITATASGSRNAEAEVIVHVDPMQDHDPATDDECDAYWTPLLLPTQLANGWIAKERDKDGVHGTIPDDRYQSWVFAFKKSDLDLGTRTTLGHVYEDIDHTAAAIQRGEAVADASYTTSDVGSILAEPEHCEVYIGDYLSSGVTSFTLISHTASDGSNPEKLVVETQGTEQLYTKPVYRLTLVRGNVPDAP
jgi:hypothetical protein